MLTVIAGDHRQAGQPTLGRLALKNHWQLASTAKVQPNARFDPTDFG
jgi:hypothetical protein